jgi:uncharacterized protein (TIRG00374 family)
MKKNWVRTGIIVGLTAFFLFLFIRSVNWKEAISHFSNVNVFLLIVIVLLFPLNYFSRGFRWKYLLKEEKSDVSLYNRFAAYVIGFTMIFIFPARVGEVIRPLFLAQKEGMRKGFVLGTAVVERIFDIFTMCFLLGFFLMIKPMSPSFLGSNTKVYSNLHIWGIIAFGIASIVLIVSLLLYFFKDKTLLVINFLMKPLPKKFSDRILSVFDEFVQGLKFFHSLKNFFMFIIWSFVVWLGIIFFFWMFVRVFGVHIPYFNLFPYVFMVMVGASIPTPGMIGGYHILSQLGLTSLYGVDPNLAGGMTVVMHFLQLVLTCLMGFVILWKEGISLIQIKKMGEGQQS